VPLLKCKGGKKFKLIEIEAGLSGKVGYMLFRFLASLVSITTIGTEDSIGFALAC
jgi:hypothetical protein